MKMHARDSRFHLPVLTSRMQSTIRLLAITMLLIVCLCTIWLLAYRIHRHEALTISGAAVGYGYHQLDQSSWMGTTAIRRNENGRFDAKLRYSGGLSFLNTPAFSEPVLVDIPSSGIAAFDQIRTCQKLQHFSCTWSFEVPALDLTQIPIEGSLDSLRVIHIGTEEPIGAQTNLQTIAQCDALEVLWIPRYSCSDQDISTIINLQKLKLISLSGSGITSNSLKYLEQMPCLKAVFFGSNVSISKDLLPEWTRRTGITVSIGAQLFGVNKGDSPDESPILNQSTR